MLVGYMRVSKADGSQVTDLQRDALLAAGVDPRHLYEDAASGRRDDRPGLASCLKALREGDTLTVWKLDRLGRDLRHLVNLVCDLKERHIGLKVLTGQGAAIDTTSAAGRMVFGFFASLAEFERELIREWVRGIKSARHKGKQLGRKRVVFDRGKAREMHEAGATVRGIAVALQVGKGTIHRFLLSQKLMAPARV